MPIVSFQFGQRPVACLKVTRADFISMHSLQPNRGFVLFTGLDVDALGDLS